MGTSLYTYLVIVSLGWFCCSHGELDSLSRLAHAHMHTVNWTVSPGWHTHTCTAAHCHSLYVFYFKYKLLHLRVLEDSPPVGMAFSAALLQCCQMPIL